MSALIEHAGRRPIVRIAAVAAVIAGFATAVAGAGDGRPSGELFLADNVTDANDASYFFYVDYQDDGGLDLDTLAPENITVTGPGGTLLELTGVSSDQQEERESQFFPTLSADGRSVAFLSDKSTLVPNDTNSRFFDIFIRDLDTRITRRIVGNGQDTLGDVRDASFSADLRFFTFTSQQTNLVPDDDNNSNDVFFYDTATNTVELITVSLNRRGRSANGPSRFPSISANGRFVVFVSDASDLVSNDTNSLADIFVYDRNERLIERVNVAPNGAQTRNGNTLTRPQISGDGRVIVFESDASNLVPGDDNNAVDFFTYDFDTNTTERIGLCDPRDAIRDDVCLSDVSDDGNFIVFSAADGNGLVDVSGMNLPSNVFLYDRRRAELSLVSSLREVAGSNPPDDRNVFPSISGDGSTIAYYSATSGLLPPNRPGDQVRGLRDILVFDRATQQTEAITVAFNHDPPNTIIGADCRQRPCNPSSFNADVSEDGRYVAYWSRATNLVDVDGDGVADDGNFDDGSRSSGFAGRDIYVRDRFTNTTVRASGNTTTAPPRELRVTYAVRPPGGRWDGRRDNGSYEIRLNAGEVGDLNGNTAPARRLGAFTVNVPVVDIEPLDGERDISAGGLHSCGIDDGGVARCWGDDDLNQSSPPGGRFIQLSVGFVHTCGLRQDGTIGCWGGDFLRQLSAPGGRFEQLSSGGFHSCALDAEGRATCWGGVNPLSVTLPRNDDVGQIDYAQLSAGFTHTCGLRAGGSVICVGSNTDGESAPPPGLVLVQISAGVSHSCGIDPDGRAVCWGNNDFGQSANRAGPYRQISVGSFHTCAVRRSDGSLDCWGAGTRDLNEFPDFGQAAPPAGAFSEVSAGDRHSCGVTAAGRFLCWGDDGDNRSTPPAGTDYSALDAGGQHNCALRANGQPACWGDDSEDQADPPDGVTFAQVDSGGRHSCGIRSDNGRVVCWGRDREDQSSPPAGLGRVENAAAGDSHSCAVKADGSVTCWGDDSENQSSPPSFDDAEAVALGRGHSCALKTSGAVACWGNNLSERTAAPQNFTFRVISAGRDHTCGIRRDNDEVECWGANEFGQLDAPAQAFIDVSAGRQHSCGVLRSNRTAVCWGSNSTDQRDVPASLRDARFVQISAGNEHTCGRLQQDRRLVCWGPNGRGRATPPGDTLFSSGFDL